MSIDVVLSPQMEDMVRQKVASGQFESASEVVLEALRMMDAQDQWRAAAQDRLRQDIQEGLNSGTATAWQPGETKQRGRQSRKERGLSAPQE